MRRRNRERNPDREHGPNQQGRSRPRGRRWLKASLAVLLVAGGAGAGLVWRGGEDTAAAAPTTATVSTQTVETTVAASGTISPAATADLDFEVSGTVTDVFVEAGDVVRAGQVLARVDDDALLAQRTAARTTYEAALTRLDDDEDADASDTQLAADQTAIVSARASLREAREAVRDATLRASMRGTVTSVGIEVGDVVGSGSSSSSGASTSTGTTTSTTSSSAVSLVSTRRFVLDATVAAADVEQVEEGLQAEITVTGAADTVYGTVEEVGRVAETNSSGAAVFPVTIEVTGTRDDLYSGTSADATIIVAQEPDVLVVSTPALQSDGDTTYVERVADDGSTSRVDVEIGETYGMTTEILSGLEEGDVVEVPGFTRGNGSDNGGQGGFSPPEGFEPPSGGQMPGGMAP